MGAAALLPIDFVLGVIVFWLALGVTGILPARSFPGGARAVSLGALASLVLAGAVVVAIGAGPQTAVLPIGLPGLPFHLRLDPLGAFFLFPLGAAGAGVSTFAAGYFRQGEGLRLHREHLRRELCELRRVGPTCCRSTSRYPAAHRRRSTSCAAS